MTETCSPCSHIENMMVFRVLLLDFATQNTSLSWFSDIGFAKGCHIHPPYRTQRPCGGLLHHRLRGHAVQLWYHL